MWWDMSTTTEDDCDAPPRAVIVLQKVAAEKTPPNRVDAVLQQVCSQATDGSLLFTGHEFLPTSEHELEVAPDVYFQVLNKTEDGRGGLHSLRFQLHCYENDLQYLMKFVEQCSAQMERRLRNKLGSSMYFFDQVVNARRVGPPEEYLVFRKTHFTTSRTFDNVFLDDQDELRNRLDFFLTRRDWYETKGIPYSLGFLFHGPPGCGKTSTIKAIANVAKRHIINVHLSQIKTNTQLKQLFYSDELHLQDNDGHITTVHIPVSERMYVIEDIDAMNSVVTRREADAPSSYADFMGIKEAKLPEREPLADPMDLSTLLNILDGTLETPGRILVITSNFPERLDSALIRPGRIDRIVKMQKMSCKVLAAMFCDFYSEHGDGATVRALALQITGDASLERRWSPAEVNQTLFRNFHDPAKAFDELTGLGQARL